MSVGHPRLDHNRTLNVIHKCVKWIKSSLVLNLQNRRLRASFVQKYILDNVKIFFYIIILCRK